MKTKSIWQGTSDDVLKLPSLDGDKEADVVIVGGGITGLTAAMLLSDAGQRVILLEARKIGLGTTGNSTGNLYVTVDEHLSTIRKKWNADVMKSVVASRASAIDLIERTIQRFQIDCSFMRTSFNYFAEELNDEIEKFFEKESEALHEAGLSPVISENAGLPFKVVKALSVNGQAQFHPLRYCRQLAEKIRGSNCELYENSQAEEFDEENAVVRTKNGSVKAKYVIMATHTPKGVWMVQTALGPYREHGVAAELKSGSFPSGIFWGLNNPKHSIRGLQSGNKKYVMVVGDKYKTGHGHDTTEYVKGLEEYLSARVKAGPTEYVWAGQHYRAADALPYIGKHNGRTFFLTGFATDGLVYGTLAAMIAGDQILGRENAYADLYKLKRFTPAKSFREFFRENLSNIGEYFKDTPWNTDAHEFREIHRGEGKTIELNGEKLAVYRDEDGHKHIVSAVCAHMKCIVNWNPAEKTWDCPCHGSRFDVNGCVLEGPATINLPSKNHKTKSK